MAKILDDKELASCDSVALRVNVKMKTKYITAIKRKGFWVI